MRDELSLDPIYQNALFNLRPEPRLEQIVEEIEHTGRDGRIRKIIIPTGYKIYDMNGEVRFYGDSKKAYEEFIKISKTGTFTK